MAATRRTAAPALTASVPKFIKQELEKKCFEKAEMEERYFELAEAVRKKRTDEADEISGKDMYAAYSLAPRQIYRTTRKLI